MRNWVTATIVLTLAACGSKSPPSTSTMTANEDRTGPAARVEGANKQEPPPFLPFDAASSYRVYPDDSVAGKIVITLTNEHDDDVKFEVWETDRGATYRVGVDPKGTNQTSQAAIGQIERLVWFGHKTVQFENGPLKLASARGWRIDFVRHDR